MSKRIIRIFSENILENIAQFEGNKISVFEKDGHSHFGTYNNFSENIIDKSKSQLILKLKTHKLLSFEIGKIQEIQIDKIATW
jgi:hypothetical protein